MSSSSNVVAVITAFKPDSGFSNRFLPLLTVCTSVIVVDNTPGGHSGFDLPARFVVIQNLENLGLALALNAGLREARRLLASVVVLFDQDSTPSATFVGEMVRALESGVREWGPRCCLGPTHVDDGVLTAGTAGGDSGTGAVVRLESISTVTCLPTSGLTFNLSALQTDEMFSDEFFLDLVDFEWCWRLRARGWAILRAHHIRMFHRLGVEERKFLGLTFHVPAPYRHYFQVRDTLRIASKRYVPRYAKVRLIGVLPLKALIYPLILDRGIERLSWMARGVLDCLRNVRGMGAASVRLSR